AFTSDPPIRPQPITVTFPSVAGIARKRSKEVRTSVWDGDLGGQHDGRPDAAPIIGRAKDDGALWVRVAGLVHRSTDLSEIHVQKAAAKAEREELAEAA